MRKAHIICAQFGLAFLNYLPQSGYVYLSESYIILKGFIVMQITTTKIHCKIFFDYQLRPNVTVGKFDTLFSIQSQETFFRAYLTRQPSTVKASGGFSVVVIVANTIRIYLNAVVVSSITFLGNGSWIEELTTVFWGHPLLNAHRFGKFIYHILSKSFVVGAPAFNSRRIELQRDLGNSKRLIGS